MFSSRQRDELVFGTPSTSQGYQIGENLIVDHAFMENNFINFSTGSNDRQLSQTTNFGLSQHRQRESKYECNIRRVFHRDIERKRRQEMSNLYLSLRSILPLEHKGKLSVCDQMQEAMNYIKQMQKNIQELRTRRDKLKEKPNLSGTNFASPNDCDNLSNRVTVNLVPDGVEILISCSIKSSNLGLSRVLAELMEKELDVVSCVSTRTKGRFLHKILTKVRNMTSLDVSVLQETLMTKTIK